MLMVISLSRDFVHMDDLVLVSLQRQHKTIKFYPVIQFFVVLGLYLWLT